MPARVLPFDLPGVNDGAAAVRGGGVIVYPTDTVYGLGCDPFGMRSVDRLFRVKGREGKPVPVLCASLESALDLADLNEVALSLARRHWPGALTIVAPLKKKVPFHVDQGTGTVGVRVPALELCTVLARKCGGFITGTSANVSGRPSCRSAAEALEALGEKVDLILDGGKKEGPESTVVRIVGEGVELLRRGSVAIDMHRLAPGR